MIIEQYYLDCLSLASYLVGDEESGIAAVIDPQRDIDHYLADAEAMGLRIERVLLTHIHADFASGHLEMRARTGATIHLGAALEPEFSSEAVRHGDRIRLGKLELEILETPGHTPESICIVVMDPESARPHAVFTGDTLFIGAVGRPDLLVSVGRTQEEMAGHLYDSLHEKVLALPDSTIVYPGHGAGSACGKNLSTDRFSTIGDQRRLNCSLQFDSRDDFIAELTQGQPAIPAYFAFDAMFNRQDHPTLDETLAVALQPLPVDRAIEFCADGAQLLDTRAPDVHAVAHLVGSVNVGLGGRFASWAGTVLDMDRPVVLVADPGTEKEAAIRLGRIGFDNVIGYVDDIAAILTDRPELVREARRIEVGEAAALVGGASPPLVLDVRNPGEREVSHIEGSAHIPLIELEARADELPGGREILVHCASGYRSSIAASLLRRRGLGSPLDLAGGIQAWDASVARK